MTVLAAARPFVDADAGARLLAALDDGPASVRFVGGWVRDTLLGLASADVDLATVHLPAAVIARLEAAGVPFWTTPSGLAHGTVTAMPGGQPVEVTTLRRDMTTDGRRATVAYTDDWRADAERRDFTINALSADPGSFRVHDHFGGLDDLAVRRVRFIGDPLRRIAEDHLRILRFFRFHARFGADPPDPASLAACVARANDLMALSRERIADELLKLLALADPRSAVRLMLAGGLFRPILPEIAATDRLDALVARERRLGAAPAALRRLASLLPRDPALAESVGARLKLPIVARKRLARLARPDAPGLHARRFAHGLAADDARDLYLLSDLDDAVVDARLAELAGWTPPEFPLKGGELVALGLTAGPKVAALLASLRAEWVAADFPDAEWVRARAAQAVRASQ